MSSTNRLLMASQDMTDDLKHPHPDFPFATIGDEKISGLATLADIFTRKTLQKFHLHQSRLQQKNKQPEARVQSTLTSPLRHQYHTKFQKQFSPTSQNSPQPPRVVTPAAGCVAPPRVPTAARRVSPPNLSQDFLDMGGENCAIAFVENHWTQTPMMNEVIHPVTGKEMQYKDLMKDPELAPLFEIGLGNELGRICQGIKDIAGTNTAFFVELPSIPKDRKITYGKLVCNCKPNKTEKHRVRLMVGGDRLDYNGETATSTVDITTFKILINSTLSTKDAKMTMMDIKNFLNYVTYGRTKESLLFE
jgi:hypothetical protein